MGGGALPPLRAAERLQLKRESVQVLEEAEVSAELTSVFLEQGETLMRGEG
jgi:hypothetical protein